MTRQPWTQLKDPGSREKILFIPALLGIASFVYLSFQYLASSLQADYSTDSKIWSNGTSKVSPQYVSDLIGGGDETPPENIEYRDSLSITGFRLVRLLAILALVSLQIFELAQNGDSNLKAASAWSILAFYVYTSILASFAIAARAEWRRTSNRQVAITMAGAFLAFFYLDVWPFATSDQRPYHNMGDPISWARLGLLCLAGLLVSLFSPRSTSYLERSDEDSVSLFSRALYGYLTGFVLYVWRARSVSIDELPNISLKEKSDFLRRRIFPEMDPVLLGRKRHTFWGMLRAFRLKFIELLFWTFIEYSLKFATPLGVKNTLAYLESGISPMGVRPWVWIVVLGLGPVISGCASQQFSFIGSRFTVEIDSMLTQLVFEHALRIRLKSDALDEKAKAGTSEIAKSPQKKEATAEGSNDAMPEGGHSKAKIAHLVGKINTLITSDSGTIQTSYLAISLLAYVVQAVISVYFLYFLLGWSAFVGLAILLITTPAPAYIGKLIMTVQRNKMGLTDKRVQTVTESLGIVRMIKLFAWEKHVLRDIGLQRKEELDAALRGRLFDIIMNFVNFLFPVLSKIITIGVYALVAKGDLSASRMFTASMIFYMIEVQVFQITFRVPMFLRAKIAWDRINEFLNGAEILQDKLGVVNEDAAQAPTFDRDVIGFNACTFSWDPFDSAPERGRHREQFFLRFESEVTFLRERLNIIVGPTGSGKTSILMALLGEMYHEPGGPGSWYNLPRDVGVAFAAQESWVLNETIRDNILLGRPYDESRYRKVLHQCALERDLNLWEAGDLTEVGEKGVTLSGGQKARVTLARAFYSDASILLLDDVLAALDVHTAKWVVEKAFLGDLVKNRTVILVTHNLGLVMPIADKVVSLSRNGTVVAQGPVDGDIKRDLLQKEVEEEPDPSMEENGTERAAQDVEGTQTVSDTNVSGRLVTEEAKAVGGVKWAALKLFVDGVGNIWIWIFVVLISSSYTLVSIFERWVMGWWTSQYETHLPSEVPVVFFLSLYSAGSLLGIVMEAVQNSVWIMRTIRASRVIFSKLLESVFASTFRWLDVTPVGRITTRTTQDINIIDGPFAAQLGSLISTSMSLITLFITTVTMAGWSAFIPGVILVLLGVILGRIYAAAQIGIRRELSNAKAPVMSHVSAVLAGIISIRAYSAQSHFRTVLKRRCDTLVRSALAFSDVNRWLSMRIDILSGLFATVATIYFVYFSKLQAGYVGFTLTLVFSFSENVLYWVRLLNYVEVQGNSLERIQDMLEIEHEPANTERGVPPAYWPSSGTIRAENLSARYSEDSPEVLHNLSFEIKSGEKIGIVGRTGAGKSSVALALLRAIKTTGQVYYDGLSASEINLDSLRSNITLIPQHPELMHGSLRENLDPFGQHDDGILNDALQAAGFFDVHVKGEDTSQNANNESEASSSSDTAVASDSASTAASTVVSANELNLRKIGLDVMVESGGTNFSLGQRQIIALARAIVRRSKLLILDEATAAIDYETDAIIQRALRTEFDKDTTSITIAHRLQTIMDADRIMVLDAGHIAEFDTPKLLLSKEGGLLRSLVMESNDRELLLEAAGVGSQ